MEPGCRSVEASTASAKPAHVMLNGFGDKETRTQSISGSPLFWIVVQAPLGFVFALGFGIQRMSAGTATLLFWIYAAVMGLSLGGIFLVYTGTSIARVFVITAATFGAMSLYRYTED